MELCLTAEAGVHERGGDTEGSLGGRTGTAREGGRGGQGRYGWIRWKYYCIIFNTLGTDPSAPLTYDTGSEHHRPTISMLEGHGGQLEREREQL